VPPASSPGGWSRRKKLTAGVLAGAGALVAAVILVVVLAGGSPTVAAEITVANVINRVETDQSRGAGPVAEHFLPAVVGQLLLPGDGVRTFMDSEARVDIRFHDYTKVSRTKPNTLWRLGQFALEYETIIELSGGVSSSLTTRLTPRAGHSRSSPRRGRRRPGAPGSRCPMTRSPRRRNCSVSGASVNWRMSTAPW